MIYRDQYKEHIFLNIQYPIHSNNGFKMEYSEYIKENIIEKPNNNVIILRNLQEISSIYKII